MRSLYLVLTVAALAVLAWLFRERLPVPIDLRPDTPESAVGVQPTPAGPVGGPGIYFARERVVVTHNDGVKALLPGEAVRLMYRHKDGRMLVTNGAAEFLVAPSALSRQPGGEPVATPSAR